MAHGSLQIKSIPDPGLNLGPLALKIIKRKAHPNFQMGLFIVFTIIAWPNSKMYNDYLIYLFPNQFESHSVYTFHTDKINSNFYLVLVPFLLINGKFDRRHSESIKSRFNYLN